MSRTPRRIRSTIALGVGAAVAVSGAALVVAAPGAAAAGKPLAQSVGRFLDGTVGGKPIQALADVKDARATNPGNGSSRNPLDVTALGKLEIPLGSALQLPGGGVFTLGAVNQVAQANSDGYAYGASGAVSNSGGISLGGSSQFPANAKISLSDASLGSITIPGLPALPPLPNNLTRPAATAKPAAATKAPALGGVFATIGAVSGLAQTESGGKAVAPKYQIAGLGLELTSPALAGLLSQLNAGSAQLQTLINRLKNGLGALGALLPPKCIDALTTIPNKITLDKGAVVIDIGKATITIDLAKLLQQLGLNLNELPANTDLLAYLLNNLGSILSKGLENIVNGLIDPITNLSTGCIAKLKKLPIIGQVVGLLGDLTSGQAAIEGVVNQIAGTLAKAGAPGLKAITDNLAKVAAIGVNVESGPGKIADNTKYKFDSVLAATPDQATSPVAGQTLVRAIEIDLLGGKVASLALGNAAAGPSSAASPNPTPTTAVPTTTVPGTAVPTGIPAGRASVDAGTPLLPVVLLVLGLLMAGGGAVTWRLRTGKHGG